MTKRQIVENINACRRISTEAGSINSVPSDISSLINCSVSNKSILAIIGVIDIEDYFRNIEWVVYRNDLLNIKTGELFMVYYSLGC